MRNFLPVLGVFVFCCTLGRPQAGVEDLLAAKGYRLLAIDGVQLRWGAAGQPADIRYAFASRRVDRAGAYNCRAIGPLEDSALGGRAMAFRADVRLAMEAWEAVANIRFTEVKDIDEAALLIGAQISPRGIAYADVKPGRRLSPATGEIAAGAVCFNPQLAWEVRTFDGNPKTPNVRYIAVHELGHVLGLDHVLNEQAVMDHHNRELVQEPQAADILGVQALYGPSRLVTAAE